MSKNSVPEIQQEKNQSTASRAQIDGAGQSIAIETINAGNGGNDLLVHFSQPGRVELRFYPHYRIWSRADTMSEEAFAYVGNEYDAY